MTCFGRFVRGQQAGIGSAESRVFGVRCLCLSASDRPMGELKTPTGMVTPAFLLDFGARASQASGTRGY
jgi:hypothetical protein